MSTSFCRICETQCLEYFELSSPVAFSAQSRSGGEVSYKHALKVCTRFELSSSGILAEVICSGCANELRISYKFFKKVWDIQDETYEDKLLLDKFKLKECYVRLTKFPLNFADLMGNQSEESFDDERTISIDEVEIKSEIMDDDEWARMIIENLDEDEDDEGEVNIDIEMNSDDGSPLEEDDDVSVDDPIYYGHALEVENSTMDEKDYDLENSICKKCDRQFANKFCLIRHKKLLHINVTCSKCKMQFDNANLLKTHMRKTHNAPRCIECNRTFTNPYSLRRHNLIIHDLPQNKCREIQKSDILEIIVDATQDPPLHKYKCKRCECICYSKKMFARHAEQYHGSRSFKCVGCDLDFPKRQKLLNHIRCEHRRCDECNIEFTRYHSFLRHIVEHHNGPQHYVSNILLENSDSETLGMLDTLACFTCERNFSSTFCLKRHINVIHNGLNPDLRTVNCQKCNLTFGDLKDFRHHEVICKNPSANLSPAELNYRLKSMFTKKSGHKDAANLVTLNKPVSTMLKTSEGKRFIWRPTSSDHNYMKAGKPISIPAESFNGAVEIKEEIIDDSEPPPMVGPCVNIDTVKEEQMDFDSFVEVKQEPQELKVDLGSAIQPTPPAPQPVRIIKLGNLKTFKLLGKLPIAPQEKRVVQTAPPNNIFNFVNSNSSLLDYRKFFKILPLIDVKRRFDNYIFKMNARLFCVYTNSKNETCLKTYHKEDFFLKSSPFEEFIQNVLANISNEADAFSRDNKAWIISKITSVELKITLI